MSSSTFATVLREEREAVGLSLRQLADRADLNPGYVSRLQSGEVVPLEENLLKLADALAAAVDHRVATREACRTKLAEAAGRIPKDAKASTQIKTQFASRLRAEGLVERQIRAALKSVSLPTMVRVLKGAEPLQIMPIERLGDPKASLDLEQEVVVIPDAEQEFRAGDRASILVKGPLSTNQKEQIRLLAQLVRTIVGHGY